MSSSVYFLSLLVVHRCTAGNPAWGYAESLEVMKTTDYADSADITDRTKTIGKWTAGVRAVDAHAARTLRADGNERGNALGAHASGSLSRSTRIRARRGAATEARRTGNSLNTNRR